MTYLHGRSSPVVHRDVKPRNVVRRPDGSYVFVDFGAVSERMSRRGGSTVVGTLGYMAPEQFQGRALPATDVYAVGATALAALTGKEPDTLAHHGLRVDVRGALQGRVSAAMVASLERMLEPDPDRRPTSLASALDGPVSMPPPPPRASHAPPVDGARENAAVKSIRNLLWLLWGLGWILVPLVLRQLHAQNLIPLVMFGSLAGLFVVTWHKGTIIRAALRAFQGQQSSVRATPLAEVAPPQRIDVGHDRQVRVHTSELRPEELVGHTEVQPVESARMEQARRR